MPGGRDDQAELGERIGVTRQTIAAIEQGKYSPTLEPHSGSRRCSASR
ncbi:MAG: helix-turn-helix domain-containing protein [Sphingomonas sp.]